MSHHLSQNPSADDIAADAAAFRTPDFLEAVIAAVSFVIHADGEVASVERSHVVSVMSENPAFSSLSRGDILDRMAVHEANYRLDPEVAMELARESIASIADRPRLASTVVRICRSIIPADGVIHPAEHRALAEIRMMLGLTARPVAFGSFGQAVKAASRPTSA